MNTKETADKLTEEVVTIIVKQILRGDTDVIKACVKKALDQVRADTIKEIKERVSSALDDRLRDELISAYNWSNDNDIYDELTKKQLIDFVLSKIEHN